MLLATVRAPEPDKQKGRPVAGRPSEIYVNNGTDADSIKITRIARLTALCGVTGRRAELVADLVWGAAA